MLHPSYRNLLEVQTRLVYLGNLVFLPFILDFPIPTPGKDDSVALYLLTYRAKSHYLKALVYFN